MAYMASFGLAPYFSENLVKQLSEVPFYSLSFDESYNSVVKKEQLDVLVRYYDVERSKVVDRYVCSKFLGHTRADNLLDSIREAVHELELEKIINIGMDGPAVNHRLFKFIISFIYFSSCLDCHGSRWLLTSFCIIR